MKFTKTVLDRLEDANRVVPAKLLIDCVLKGRAAPDSQGCANTVMY